MLVECGFRTCRGRCRRSQPLKCRAVYRHPPGRNTRRRRPTRRRPPTPQRGISHRPSPPPPICAAQMGVQRRRLHRRRRYPGEGAHRFSSPLTTTLNHLRRAEFDAIAVGAATVIADSPALTVRDVAGRSPQAVIFDRHGIVAPDNKLLIREKPAIVIGDVPLAVLFTASMPTTASLLVEGGRGLLQSFIDADIWDAARVEVAPYTLEPRLGPCPQLRRTGHRECTPLLLAVSDCQTFPYGLQPRLRLFLYATTRRSGGWHKGIFSRLCSPAFHSMPRKYPVGISPGRSSSGLATV